MTCRKQELQLTLWSLPIMSFIAWVGIWNWFMVCQVWSLYIFLGLAESSRKRYDVINIIRQVTALSTSDFLWSRGRISIHRYNIPNSSLREVTWNLLGTMEGIRGSLASFFWEGLPRSHTFQRATQLSSGGDWSHLDAASELIHQSNSGQHNYKTGYCIDISPVFHISFMSIQVIFWLHISFILLFHYSISS